MKSVGLTLRQAREARDMSIEDVARITRISRSVIEALEVDDRDALPADVYVRGFTRNIAIVLGLDPRSLVHSRTTTQPQMDPPVFTERREDERFAMLFGYRPSDRPALGRVHLIMTLVALSMFFAAWLLVGTQSTSHETAHDLQNGIPAIQEHVDAVTPFTAQGMRADARR